MTDDSDYKEYFETDSEAITLLKKHGFIHVKSEFDKYSFSDMRELKPQLPTEFVEKYELWEGYTG